MRQCKYYDDAFYSDCCVCDENCEYRKKSSVISTVLIIFLTILFIGIVCM